MSPGPGLRLVLPTPMPLTFQPQAGAKYLSPTTPSSKYYNTPVIMNLYVIRNVQKDKQIIFQTVHTTFHIAYTHTLMQNINQCSFLFLLYMFCFVLLLFLLTQL